MPEELEILRGRIQEIDEAIIRLLGQRLAHVRLLARWKASAGIPVEDASRDAERTAFYRAAAHREGLDPAFVQRLFSAVRERSRCEQYLERRRRDGA